MQRSTAEINEELHADRIEKLNQKRLAAIKEALENCDDLAPHNVVDRPISKSDFVRHATTNLKRIMKQADLAEGEE